jgi:hypothetical protein
VLSCKKSSTSFDEAKYPNDNLKNSATEWLVDFSDYPKGEENFYELGHATSNLPAPLDTSLKALKISGNNHSDDLFMFMKKKITGLKPDQDYNITISVKLASASPGNGIGIGGGPGGSVYLKAGLVPSEPLKILGEDQKHYVLNFDKGNQAKDGADLHNMGNIANGLTTYEYAIIERSVKLKGKSDAQGTAWIVIGTDSGFEGTTTLYYTDVNVGFEE